MIKPAKILALILLTLIVPTVALAAEKAVLCAKYAANYGYSQGYKVQGIITKGSELNQATKTLNYLAFATYVVIFWNQGEASIIQMQFPFVGPIGGEGVDQQGRSWNIAKSNFCI